MRYNGWDGSKCADGAVLENVSTHNGQWGINSDGLVSKNVVEFNSRGSMAGSPHSLGDNYCGGGR